MIDLWNHWLFATLAAPDDLSGPALVAALALAQASVYAAPCVLVLLWMFGDHLDRRAAISAAGAAVLALALAGAISSAVMHPRPFMDSSARNYLNHVPDSSFPSDHAVLLFAVGLSLLLSYSAVARCIGLGVAILALATGWSRVFLGAHYPFDIVGAAAIGLACGLVFKLAPLQRGFDRLAIWGERLRIHFE